MTGQQKKTSGSKTQSVKLKAVASELYEQMPKVTVLIPVHRLRDYENIRSNVSRQTYKNCEFVIVADTGFPVIEFGGVNLRWMEVDSSISLGNKRNFGLDRSSGEYILHMDSDDIYASDWVEKSISFMLAHPKCLVTGLSECEFHDITNGNKYLYKYSGRMGYVVGATMCYRRDLWSAIRFSDMNESEDTDFVSKSAMGVVAHGYKDGFTAILHGSNTASHKSISYMTRV